MIRVCVDTGLRECGVSIFRDRELIRAGLVRNPETTGRGPKVWLAMAREVNEWLRDLPSADELVLEVMQSYDLRHQKGDQNDLLELAGVGGAIVGILSPERVTGYRPAEWKGQVPKVVHHKRIQRELTEQEVKRIEKCPESLKHNVIDAIGIGLFHCKRMSSADGKLMSD
jgi:hypothetical protein